MGFLDWNLTAALLSLLTASDLAVFTLPLAQSFPAGLSRWFEVLRLPPESQMDSFCGGGA